MRQASLSVSLVSSCLLVSGVHAASIGVTTATAYTSTTGCSESCDAFDGPCSLICDNQTDTLVEFATAQLALTPISFTASATADGITLGGKTKAHVMAGFNVEFTLTEPTFVYVEWNIFFPVAETNFLSPPLPADGIWVGELQPGNYFAHADHMVMGEGAQASGIFVRVIPDPDADCDGDGVFDYLEIVNGTQQDADFDGVPDDCGVEGDLDGDGAVGAADLAILLGAWGGGGDADLDGDGTVGAADLAVLLGQWG
jgi:hypothetical protein